MRPGPSHHAGPISHEQGHTSIVILSAGYYIEMPFQWFCSVEIVLRVKCHAVRFDCRPIRGVNLSSNFFSSQYPRRAKIRVSSPQTPFPLNAPSPILPLFELHSLPINSFLQFLRFISRCVDSKV